MLEAEESRRNSTRVNTSCESLEETMSRLRLLQTAIIFALLVTSVSVSSPHPVFSNPDTAAIFSTSVVIPIVPANAFAPGVTKSGVTKGNVLPQDVTAIAAGASYTCVLTNAGGVACWGDGFGGQMAAISGLTSGITAIAAGKYYANTCVLTSAGGVKCWGVNGSGQLGDGTTIDRPTPVNVSGLTSGVMAITTGGGHTCALTSVGGVKCWGENGYGQLGDGTTTPHLTPEDVNGLTSGMAAIAAGGGHTCALTGTGGVKCWGENSNGQLGDDTTIDRHSPVEVSGLTSGVTAIAIGSSHTCALTSAGGVKCWGANYEGELGDGTTAHRLTPVDVSGLTSGVTAITAGGGHTCALTSAGGAKCWGENYEGELGDGATIARLSPVDVSGLTNGVTTITTGGGHTCALTSAGGIKCWGSNYHGELGDGAPPPPLVPVDVNGLTNGGTAITAGHGHTCALTSAGGLKCWGWNDYGQLGDGTTTERLTPADVSGFNNGGRVISAGYGHTCALTSAGGAKCWGWNSHGQLGDGTTTTHFTPVDVSGLTSGVRTISTGELHTCALTSVGGVKCWGYNGHGELGDGTMIDRLAPVDVSGLTSEVTAITVGDYHTCALTSAGGVKCWGYNDDAQLGDGSWDDHHTPVQVSGLTSGVAAISAGGRHTCALMSTGAVKCWGDAQQTTPHDVNGLTSDVTAISAGGDHTCALTSVGGVKCWGWNDYGQLGDGTITQRFMPVEVSGLTGGITAIAAGRFHTCALTNTGGVKCWGWNYYGQLGNGLLAYRTTPVAVVIFVRVYLPTVGR
jgi:alpha-tubulin suppressor-like RCC1 family protein